MCHRQRGPARSVRAAGTRRHRGRVAATIAPGAAAHARFRTLKGYRDAMRFRHAIAVLRAATVSLTLAACSVGTGQPPGTTESEASQPAATAGPSDGGHYPEGASADTPLCQDASPATVAAVNATIENPAPGQSTSLERLIARPDPAHAVWLLTGVIETGGTEGGYYVAWATSSDPTQAEFTGTLRSLGNAAQLSSAPALLLPDVPRGELPAAALACPDGGY